MASATATSTVTAAVKSVTSGADVAEVVIHPLVLLSAADHYHRVARGTRKRVVGVVLGSIYKGNVDATNSFAVPFEEDSRNPVR
jgi:26S proteasome regulatory subunit N8